jgi:hypothetical protein
LLCFLKAGTEWTKTLSDLDSWSAPLVLAVGSFGYTLRNVDWLEGARSPQGRAGQVRPRVHLQRPETSRFRSIFFRIQLQSPAVSVLPGSSLRYVIIDSLCSSGFLYLIREPSNLYVAERLLPLYRQAKPTRHTARPVESCTWNGNPPSLTTERKVKKAKPLIEVNDSAFEI